MNDNGGFYLKNKRQIITEYSTHNSETKTATFQGKQITVTHLTPRLTAEEQTKRRQEVEHHLYDVFVKYKKSA